LLISSIPGRLLPIECSAPSVQRARSDGCDRL